MCKISDRIEKLAQSSANAWSMAVETAGPDYLGGSDAAASAMAALADECSDAYEAAGRAVLDGDVIAAESELERARSLEAEGGDDSHARDALEALADMEASHV